MGWHWVYHTTCLTYGIQVSGLNPSEKYESQLGWLFPIYGKIKNVPNHQPVIKYVFFPCMGNLHCDYGQTRGNMGNDEKPKVIHWVSCFQSNPKFARVKQESDWVENGKHILDAGNWSTWPPFMDKLGDSEQFPLLNDFSIQKQTMCPLSG